MSDPYAEIPDDPYAEIDTIPNTNNLLEKAINSAREIGAVSSSLAFPFPQIGEQLSRAPMGGPIELSADVSQGNIRDTLFHVPEAETKAGIAASSILPFFLPGIGGIKLAGKGLKGLNPGPIKKKMSAIEGMVERSIISEAPIKEEISQIGRVGKILEDRSSRGAKEIGYQGGKGVKESAEKFFKEANDKFGAGFSKLESQMTNESFEDIINKAAREVGAETIPGTPGNKLASQAMKLGITKGEEEAIQMAPRVYNKKEVQAITRKILDSLPEERTKAIFYKHLSNALPENVPGLKELKAAHSKVYPVLKESKQLTEPSIRSVASGAAPSSKVKDLAEIEKGLGTNYIDKAIKHQGKSKAQQTRLSKRGSKAEKRLGAKKEEQTFLSGKLPGLERAVQDVRFNQAATAGAASLIGLGSWLNRIFRAENLRQE